MAAAHPAGPAPITAMSKFAGLKPELIVNQFQVSSFKFQVANWAARNLKLETRNWFLPYDRAHATEEVPAQLDAWGAAGGEQRAHFAHRVGAANRDGAVVPRDWAARERQRKIHQAKVEQAAAEVVEDDGDAADAQCLRDEATNLIGLEMVEEERAADQVHAGVAEGQGKGIADDARDCAGGAEMG